MNLSDTFYVALCMTILILGVVYWFWTQNQFIQRKLNLLENIVYDMKSSLNSVAPDPVEKALASASLNHIHSHMDAAAAAGGSGPVDLNDLDADDEFDVAFSASDAKDTELTAPDSVDAVLAQQSAQNSADVAPEPDIQPFDMGTPISSDDLAPGGISGLDIDVSDTSNETVLNSMGLKELKELAEQKKIPNAKKMRKHELVAAIRASKTTVTPFEIKEGTIELN